MSRRGRRLCGEVVRVHCAALGQPDDAMTMFSATRSQDIWLARLCALTAFVLSLGWAPSAFAAVPMCGNHAQTIAAPPIGTPASNAAVTDGDPCANDGTPLRAAGAPNRNAPRDLTLTELPVRALPLLSRFGPRAASARLSTAAVDQELPAPGFARSIDRPPRA